MVLVVRTDLGMTKGKISAQCGHAILGTFKKATALATIDEVREAKLCLWMHNNERKVRYTRFVLPKKSGGPIQIYQVKSEDELRQVHSKAQSISLASHTVRDAGKTQIARGSMTVCGFGPLTEDQMDHFSGLLEKPIESDLV